MLNVASRAEAWHACKAGRFSGSDGNDSYGRGYIVATVAASVGALHLWYRSGIKEPVYMLERGRLCREASGKQVLEAELHG